MLGLVTAPARRLFALAAALITSACMTGTSNHNERSLLAQNREWTVTAVGPLDAVGSSFGLESHVKVMFAVQRNGEMYAAGHLYDAGPHDAFNIDHPRRDWVTPNSLRLWGQPSREHPFTILVHNESPRAIRWLRIRTQEIFLLLAVPPKATITLPSLYWGQYGWNVTGEFEDGTPIVQAVEDQKEGPRPTEIVVGASTTTVR